MAWLCEREKDETGVIREDSRTTPDSFIVECSESANGEDEEYDFITRRLAENVVLCKENTESASERVRRTVLRGMPKTN